MVADPSSDKIWAASTANLYSIDVAGTISSHGAHGAGTTKALSTGGSFTKAFIAGATEIRKWDGAAFSTFSTTSADQIAFLNNTLYGMSSNGFLRYDTAGVATTIFQWKSADGVVVSTSGGMVSLGGKLVILRSVTEEGSDLWLFDGTAPARIANLPNGFIANSITVVAGVVFISGYLKKRLSATQYRKPVIYFYSGGSIGELWKSDSWVASTAAQWPVLAGWQSGLVFTDDVRGVFMYYDPANGGIHAIGAYTTTNANPYIAAASSFFLHSREATQPYRHPADGFSSSGSVTTSLIDFDSSLEKIFRGIRVDWDDDASDTGATVDIAYRLNDLDGSYTTLQTGAASGTEYTLSNIAGRSISVKVTLNKSGSTVGPTLKRISVRAMPIQTGRRRHTYLVAFEGSREGRGGLHDRTDMSIPKTGAQIVSDLRAVASSTSPVTVTDFTGTYTALVDPETFDVQLHRPRHQAGFCRITFQEV
jgi:hypothetical protein